MKSFKHFLWFAAAMSIGFFIPFLFANSTCVPVDLYYLIYFTAIILFLTCYARFTNLNCKEILSKNLKIAVALGLIFAVIMFINIFSRPETAKLSGLFFIWALIWRGLLYGAIDGLFLTSFPCVIVWRAFEVDKRNLTYKIFFSLLAYIFIIVLTTSYHLGYSDFRSSKLIQPIIGNTIMSIPTLLSSNPISSPVAHAAMHVAAVIHSPQTDIFLPPHR